MRSLQFSFAYVLNLNLNFHFFLSLVIRNKFYFSFVQWAFVVVRVCALNHSFGARSCAYI